MRSTKEEDKRRELDVRLSHFTCRPFLRNTEIVYFDMLRCKAQTRKERKKNRKKKRERESVGGGLRNA